MHIDKNKRSESKMRKIGTTLYEFKELSKKSQKKAIEDMHTQINEDYDYESEIITGDMMETIIDKFGSNTIRDLEVHWSLNCSQGDGVSFTGTIYGYSKTIDIMLNNMYEGNVPKNVKRIIHGVNFKFTCNSARYCHEMTVNTDSEITGLNTGNIERIEKLVNEIETKLEDFRIDVCKLLEKNGYTSIDFYDSDEYIIESIEANDLEYLEDGSRYEGNE
jgi:hypothetical protein